MPMAAAIPLAAGAATQIGSKIAGQGQKNQQMLMSGGQAPQQQSAGGGPLAQILAMIGKPSGGVGAAPVANPSTAAGLAPAAGAK
jgi:hypothetical protein